MLPGMSDKKKTYRPIHSQKLPEKRDFVVHTHFVKTALIALFFLARLSPQGFRALPTPLQSLFAPAPFAGDTMAPCEPSLFRRFAPYKSCLRDQV